jgi:hypothetical protein
VILFLSSEGENKMVMLVIIFISTGLSLIAIGLTADFDSLLIRIFMVIIGLVILCVSNFMINSDLRVDREHRQQIVQQKFKEGRYQTVKTFVKIIEREKIYTSDGCFYLDKNIKQAKIKVIKNINIDQNIEITYVSDDRDNNYIIDIVKIGEDYK